MTSNQRKLFSSFYSSQICPFSTFWIALQTFPITWGKTAQWQLCMIMNFCRVCSYFSRCLCSPENISTDNLKFTWQPGRQSDMITRVATNHVWSQRIMSWAPWKINLWQEDDGKENFAYQCARGNRVVGKLAIVFWFVYYLFLFYWPIYIQQH